MGDELEARGRARLAAIARETGCPLDDLLDWYAGDLGDLGTMELQDVRDVVHDYLRNRHIYRGAINSGR